MGGLCRGFFVVISHMIYMDGYGWTGREWGGMY